MRSGSTTWKGKGIRLANLVEVTAITKLDLLLPDHSTHRRRLIRYSLHRCHAICLRRSIYCWPFFRMTRRVMHDRSMATNLMKNSMGLVPMRAQSTESMIFLFSSQVLIPMRSTEQKILLQPTNHCMLTRTSLPARLHLVSCIYSANQGYQKPNSVDSLI